MNAKNTLGNFAVILLAIFWSAGALAGEDQERIVVSDVGFSTPESVEYYAGEDVYLVSNINGSPSAADGNGFIAKLKPDGSVVALKWIDGAKENVMLNAPKGSAVVDGNLFVADLNQVQVFGLPGGEQKTSIAIEGSTFLNGMTPGPDGSVYVTDTGFAGGMVPSGTDAVYQVWPDGQYKVIMKDKEMGHPNGIWNDSGHLVVNTLGSGELFSIDSSGKRTALPTPPTGGLDGLVRLADGRLIVSSWTGSAIYALGKDEKFTVLADGLVSPADLGVDTKRHRLLVPLFKEDKVVILPY
ncbi:MAG: SMP-30/gluconolactonase/LRE family protein [Candidatus Electrothrix sp. YB6]